MSLDSIGSAGGRDFANLADWFAAIPGTLAEPEIGEVYNDSLFTLTATMDFTGKTVGAFSITLRPATGQGFADSASGGGFKLDFNQTQGAAFSETTGYLNPMIRQRQAGMTIQGLQFRTTTGNSGTFQCDVNAVLKNCIIDGNGNTNVASRATLVIDGTVINCLIIHRNNTDNYTTVIEYGGKAINCTAVRPSGLSANGIGFREAGGTTNIVDNCAAFNFTTSFTASGWDSSSDYNCADDANAPGSNSQQSKTYANQFVSTTDDWRLKAGADCINHGNTDATNAPADIVGTTRGATTLGDIGCWEFVGAAVTGIAATSYRNFPKNKLRQPIIGGRTR